METAFATRRSFNRAKFANTADWLAIAVAASLLWSTSATGIPVALWLVALVPTVNFGERRRVVRHLAGALPWIYVFGVGMFGWVLPRELSQSDV